MELVHCWFSRKMYNNGNAVWYTLEDGRKALITLATHSEQHGSKHDDIQYLGKGTFLSLTEEAKEKLRFEVIASRIISSYPESKFRLQELTDKIDLSKFESNFNVTNFSKVIEQINESFKKDLTQDSNQV